MAEFDPVEHDLTKALHAFGAQTFDEMFARFCDGDWEIEFHDFITDLAVKLGLVEKTKFNPDIHDNCEECQSGDDYYVITPVGRAARERAKGLRK